VGQFCVENLTKGGRDRGLSDCRCASRLQVVLPPFVRMRFVSEIYEHMPNA